MEPVPALFLDRDGVVNEDLPTGVRSWDDFRFLPGVLDALRDLARAGVPVHVITNQAGVGRGHVSQATVDRIHARMVEAIEASGGALAGIQVCFHAPEQGCSCRKPEPGLLVAAASAHGLDLARVPFAGDDARDLVAARRAGAIPILLRTGKGRSVEPRVQSGELVAEHVFDDLPALVRWVLATRGDDSSRRRHGA